MCPDSCTVHTLYVHQSMAVCVCGNGRNGNSDGGDGSDGVCAYFNFINFNFLQHKHAHEISSTVF